MQIEEHVQLAPFTTLGIGGPARWLLTATTQADVVAAVDFARERTLPVFVLGGGSNLLIADDGFAGVVLRMAIPGISKEIATDGRTLVRAGAGEPWDGFVQFAVAADLAGVECLAGIPGTVGGTPVQNVGAYGQEVAETIAVVHAFDTQTGGFVELSNEDCGFSYRTSVLNTSERGRYIVVRVDFRLQPGGAPKLAYADLRKHFGFTVNGVPGDVTSAASPTLSEVADAVRDIRKSKGMVFDAADPNSHSAGSFFRNPIVPQEALLRVSEASGLAVDAVPHWPAGDGLVKLPAAWLLERAGFERGYALGNAGISTRHTLALVNRGSATAADMIALRERIIADVASKFGITLEQEPVSIGS
ncbi:UDP-N-acetylmuramate dehydrogenase [Terriglobus roseus]|uniref:UDP-N-acetylenolpyruvoylglucosamine reductase n=1 Tax=Terriglobus roseus TaxID=392734 RepID=A0A1H4S7V9_9BACT|nr:UDP-N-acetylmuramate dehydrogenase [Terriglobus roseus]SEC40253.1 UDP-N-acetylmuramate dehydrogenase [Terriglobus roseus]